jgi:valyl-tRNA synthetase
MIMAGIEFTGKKPFSDVVIHATVMNIEGRRMSKSLGTGVEPLLFVDEYGADALRFTLLSRSTGVQDIRLGIPHELLRARGEKPSGKDDRSLIDSRNFVTKLWNACRFALTGLPGKPGPLPALQPEDRWILSRLASTTASVTQAMEEFEFGRAAADLYHFTWDEFCDYYIELAKARMDEARPVLVHVIDALLRLLHPIAPFVTEEIWQRLREIDAARSERLMTAPWPRPDETHRDAALEETFAAATEAARMARDVRARLGLDRSSVLDAVLVSRGAGSLDLIGRIIGRLANLAVKPGAAAPPRSAACARESFTLYLPLGDQVDVAAVVARQEKHRAELRGQLEALERRLADAAFLSRAEPEKVEEERDRRDELASRVRETEESLRALSG